MSQRYWPLILLVPIASGSRKTHYLPKLRHFSWWVAPPNPEKSRLPDEFSILNPLALTTLGLASHNDSFNNSIRGQLGVIYISSMQVRIWTQSFIIQGEIDTLKDERLTDYVREKKEFIAVTQGKVMSKEGKEMFRTAFLNVATSKIEIIMPAD